MTSKYTCVFFIGLATVMVHQGDEFSGFCAEVIETISKTRLKPRLTELKFLFLLNSNHKGLLSRSGKYVGDHGG
jgi:hypothetical protein